MLIAPFRARSERTDLAWLGVPQPIAAVIVSDPERETELRKGVLRQRFGLTAAEVDLALEIIKGDGWEAAAARRGITVGTVRTHLGRIFEKTDVCRQAELVRLLLQTHADIARK